MVLNGTSDSNQQKHVHRFSGLNTGIASIGSACTTALFTCPFDVAKTRMQQSNARSADSIFTHLSRLWSMEGISGIYRGLNPTLLGYCISYSIYFPTYYWLKQEISDRQNWPLPLIHMTSAMLAGTSSNVIGNPVWLLRTRLMSQGPNSPIQYKSAIEGAKHIWRDDGGLRGFFRGTVVSMFGILHTAIQFPLYEYLKKVLRERHADADGIGTVEIIGASVLSKLMASLATYPHEVLRTRLQNQPLEQMHRGIIPMAISIWRKEGKLRAFYKGFSANLVKALPAAVITFVSFEHILQFLNS